MGVGFSLDRACIGAIAEWVALLRWVGYGDRSVTGLSSRMLGAVCLGCTMHSPSEDVRGGVRVGADSVIEVVCRLSLG